jgi:hypothetical protein
MSIEAGLLFAILVWMVAIMKQSAQEHKETKRQLADLSARVDEWFALWQECQDKER